MRLCLLALAFCLAADAASAELRPMPRPNAPAVALQSEAARPKRRPAGAETAARNPANGLLGRLFGPKAAPKVMPVKGAVCGDSGIRGAELPRVSSRIKGCGIENPVRVTEVAGVRLTTPATIDCATASALKTWVTKSVQPAFGNQVRQLRVAASYACRPRNSRKGARISEHGKGRAIDISAFILKSGPELTVLRDYSGKQGAPIRKAHKGACGIFGTTLGPGSDGHHMDHLHLDVAAYRNGPYCK